MEDCQDLSSGSDWEEDGRTAMHAVFEEDWDATERRDKEPQGSVEFPLVDGTEEVIYQSNKKGFVLNPPFEEKEDKRQKTKDTSGEEEGEQSEGEGEQSKGKVREEEENQKESKLSGWPLLLYKAKRQKFGEIEELMSALKPPPMQDKWGRTVAHYAAMTPEGKVTLEAIKKLYGEKWILGPLDHRMMTPLHYAAECYSGQDFESLISVKDGQRLLRILGKTNECGDTVLHLAAQHCNTTESALKMIKNLSSDSHIKCLSWQNNRGQTVLHLIAEYGKLEELNELLDSKAGKYCRSLTDEDGNLYYHCAVRNRCENSKVVEQIVKQMEHFKTVNNKKQNILQLAIISKQCSDKTVVDNFWKSEKINAVIKRQDAFGQTSLMYAIQKRKYKTAVEIMKSTLEDTDFWLVMNNEKNTALHMAFQDPEFTKYLKVENRNLYETMIKLSCEDGLGRSYLFYACLGWNFDPLLKDFGYVSEVSDEDDQSLRTLKRRALECVDIDGNTLLHALFMGNFKETIEGDKSAAQQKNDNQNQENSKTILVKNFFCAFQVLLEAKIDPQRENDFGHNCLHASLIFQDMLISILEELYNYTELNKNKSTDTADLKEPFKKPNMENYNYTEFKKNKNEKSTDTADLKGPFKEPNMEKILSAFHDLLVTKSGFHLMHSLASKYDLKEITAPIAALLRVPPSILLQVTVAKGPLKGATCLHIVCNANHAENIKYLVNSENQSLKSETHSGQTCLDFSRRVERVNVVQQIFMESDGSQKALRESSKEKKTVAESSEEKKTVAESSEEKKTVAESSKESQNIKTNNSSDSNIIASIDQKIELLRLIDPVQASLKLPPRAKARYLLSSILDRFESSNLIKGSTKWTNSKVRSTSLAENESFSRLKMLYIVMEFDSPDVLRSAVRLRKLDYETERSFYAYLEQHIKFTGSKDVECRKKENTTTVLEIRQSMHFLSCLEFLNHQKCP